MIEIQNVSYRYRGSKDWVLRDFCETINEGEFVVLRGSNGSGKSTLARIIAGIVKPKRGTVLVDGICTRDRRRFYDLRRLISIVFQNPENNLLFDRVFDDIAFGLENMKVPKSEWGGRVAKVLEQVGMSGFEERSTYKLSGGQKQRIAIAGVLALGSRILVADEVTAHLDTQGKEDIYNLLWELNASGVTVVLTTNIASESERGRIIDL